MLRNTVFLMVIAAFLLSAGVSYAQEDIAVRRGEHEGYSRLVFDWPNAVSFVAKKDTATLNISFSEAGTLTGDLSAKNIREIRTTSSDPLNISIEIPSGAKSRSFNIGNRVIVDVYDSVSAENTQKPQASQANKDKAQDTVQDTTPDAGLARNSAQKNVAKAPEVNAPQPSDAELSSVQSADVPDDLKHVAEKLGLHPEFPHLGSNSSRNNKDQSQVERPSIEPHKPKTKLEKLAEGPEPNIVTISSTQAMGMAAFINAEMINMVVDRNDVSVKPVVSGPNAEVLSPQKGTLKDGQDYILQTLPGAYTRVQGGGLLWNVIISPEQGEKKAVQPIRADVVETSIRGGKIIWPFETVRKVIETEDLETGQPLFIVSVEQASDFAGAYRSFVDFDVLESPLGLTIRSKVDDLSVTKIRRGVEISRPSGLAIMSAKKTGGIQKKSPKKLAKFDPEDQRIFDFADWRMGGLSALNENRNIILSDLKNMTEAAQIEGLIDLAKMHLASGRGAEALGFLNYALQLMPALRQNPEFLALSGASKAFDWKTDWAFQDLSQDALDPYQEIGLWKAFALADLGDWQQAYDVLPLDYAMIREYPSEIRNRLGIVLAEVYLRAGETEIAKDFLELVESEQDQLNAAHEAALQYLKGELERQNGDSDKTMDLWTSLTTGIDDLYRVKAGLAMTRLLVDAKKLTPEKAIDRLERLRYAWRGDELEAQVNYWLGRTYFESGAYIKGMKIMRNAAVLVPNSTLGQRVASDMQSLFAEFYQSPDLKNVSPMDAVALYEEFTELTPAGPEGDKVVSALAEHLVRADLLGRAGNLLNHQIDHRLSGDDAARTAVRLAAIRLLDNQPEQAMQALDRAESLLQRLPKDIATQARFYEISLLHARALSQARRVSEALDILENLTPGKDVNRLRTDIAWNAGYWDDASYALEDVILDENISLTRPLMDPQAMLILKQATAMNLSGDRIGLANLREKYGEAMRQTSKGRLFDVVTRPRQNVGLADKETLLSTVSEADLFEDFLNSYRTVQASSN